MHYGILVIDQLPRGELLRRVKTFLQQHQANQVKNQVWFPVTALCDISPLPTPSITSPLYMPACARKGSSFADKKNPSPWLTFLVLRVLKRWHGE